MRRILPILFLSFIGFYAKAQTPNGFVGVGNVLPKAKLDIVSDTSGILIPRYATLADVNTNVLPKMSATDHNGLTLYVAEAANRGFWFYNGTAFEKIGAGSGTGGFFKVSSSDNNHIIYSSDTNFGKNFLVNTDSVNYDGSGTDAKMMLIPSKYAVRLGAIDNTNWDIDSIGNYSFASGQNTKAKGDYSTAMGYGTNAKGSLSTAMGYETNASGNASTAMGFGTIASGYNSTAIGSSVTSSNNYTIAMGYYTTASGYSATAMGYYTTASGDFSTAMGNSTASGFFSTAMGESSTASGYVSTAMGTGTNASGYYSTAMGINTTATGNFSTSMGHSTNASGENSTAIGNTTNASGDNSTAMGVSTTASGNLSTAMGNTTKAKSFGELSIGTYNDTLTAVNATAFAGDSNRVFTVGNGTFSARNTAFVIQQNGNVGVGDRKPSSLLDVNGSLSLPIVAQSASYTATKDDYTILCSAALTLTLPDAAACVGRIYVVKKKSTTAFVVDIARTGSTSVFYDTGVAATTTSLTVGSMMTLQSDGTDWHVISKF